MLKISLKLVFINEFNYKSIVIIVTKISSCIFVGDVVSKLSIVYTVQRKHGLNMAIIYSRNHDYRLKNKV